MKMHPATASRLTMLIIATSFAANARGADLSAEAKRLDRALGNDLAFIGTIKPRDAKDIESSNWSIGAETMDRDYTVYANWRKYLGPLGAKKARIQSGWAKTEKKQGEYDWAWMDEIVLDMVEQGVEPWVCLCYGNPIYPGGGDTGLGGGLVASEEALQAWERYVAAYVERYAKYVDEWELWNEPRTGRGKGTVQYGSFVARTAAVIRRIQPNAEILFAAGGSFDSQFAKEVLDYLKKEDKLDLVDAIIYHPYKFNPDESYTAALTLRKIAKSYASHIDIRQGENGAPSKPGSFGAISGNDWTQRAQAKWLLRRLLGDLGRDIPSSYFAICDMRYPTRVNYKGLLAINEAKEVTQVKLGYHAMQHLTALFDDEVKRIKDFEATVTNGATDSIYALFGYRGPAEGMLVTLWRGSDTPEKRPDMERVTLTVRNGRFDDPVWVDLLTGRVYHIDDDAWSVVDGKSVFTGLPVYDSAVVIADRNEVARVAELKEAAISRTPPQPGPVLAARVKVRCDIDLGSVKLAVQDLAGDLEKVLGAAPKMVDEEAQIVIRIDRTLDCPESYRIDIARDSVQITGADDLGVVYGIYRFCSQFLGVDPYWFFKDIEPESKDSISLFVGTIESKKPTFRYRGWFVNDEDLLTEWKGGGGRRFIRYPFYSQVRIQSECGRHGERSPNGGTRSLAIRWCGNLDCAAKPTARFGRATRRSDAPRLGR